MNVEIIPWTDEQLSFDYDPWVAADQADQVAQMSGIRISRNKELSWIAVNDDNVVGAVWSSLEDSEGEKVFDFDVAVDPKWRSGRIGLRLIERAIKDLNEYQAMFPGTYARVWVVNPKLVRVLENKYGFNVESMYRDGSAHMTYQ
jgi:ribosomal protein S18 acetylase RimI-like enzyme